MLSMTSSIAEVRKRAEHARKNFGLHSMLMILAAQRLPSQHSHHPKTKAFKFSRRPSGTMFLQVVLMAMLREKTVRRKDQHFLRRNALHIRNQLQSVFLCEVFDEVESDTTVKFAGRKLTTDVACIEEPHLMVGVLAARFLKERLIAFHTHGVREAKIPNRRICSASNVQAGAAIGQFLPQGVKEREMEKTWEGDLEQLDC